MNSSPPKRASEVGAWLPAGAWQACVGETSFEPGERIWVGVDVGGERADSAVVWVNDNMHVGVETWTGDDAVLEVATFVAELAEKFQIVEAVYDPWRAGQMAQEWEQRGIRAVAFPQSDSRMIPASERLYDAIVHGRLVHPDDPELNGRAGRMALKPCLDCGRTTQGSRCRGCRARRDASGWTSRRQIASGWAWAELRDQVRARDRVCVRCGGSDRLHVHHRIPLGDGGSNRLDNLELVCLPCHGRAHRRKSIRRRDARRRDESGAGMSTPMIT